MQSMLPLLVPVEILPRAMAASSSAFQTAMIVGPAVGGVLYVAGPAASTRRRRGALPGRGDADGAAALRPDAAQREPTTLKTLFAGVHFIRHRPDILGVISLDLFAVLLGGATALLPVFARDILSTGPWGLGLLRAAPAVGALLTSLWLARHSLRAARRHDDVRRGRRLRRRDAGVRALDDRSGSRCSALFALGAFDMVSVVIRSALVQLDTPDAMRGRVSAVNAIFIDTLEPARRIRIGHGRRVDRRRARDGGRRRRYVVRCPALDAIVPDVVPPRPVAGNYRSGPVQ